jgi:hypothetical protein
MNSQPIHESPGEPVQPYHQDQVDDLTDEQRAFARVLGQALAEAWRRQGRPTTDQQPTSPR